MTEEQINNIARKFAELIEQDNASPSANVPTPMARISGAIREALNVAGVQVVRPQDDMHDDHESAWCD